MTKELRFKVGDEVGSKTGTNTAKNHPDAGWQEHYAGIVLDKALGDRIQYQVALPDISKTWWWYEEDLELVFSKPKVSDQFRAEASPLTDSVKDVMKELERLNVKKISFKKGDKVEVNIQMNYYSSTGTFDYLEYIQAVRRNTKGQTYVLNKRSKKGNWKIGKYFLPDEALRHTEDIRIVKFKHNNPDIKFKTIKVNQDKGAVFMQLEDGRKAHSVCADSDIFDAEKGMYVCLVKCLGQKRKFQNGGIVSSRSFGIDLAKAFSDTAVIAVKKPLRMGLEKYINSTLGEVSRHGDAALEPTDFGLRFKIGDNVRILGREDTPYQHGRYYHIGATGQIVGIQGGAAPQYKVKTHHPEDWWWPETELVVY